MAVGGQYGDVATAHYAFEFGGITARNRPAEIAVTVFPVQVVHHYAAGKAAGAPNDDVVCPIRFFCNCHGGSDLVLMIHKGRSSLR